MTVHLLIAPPTTGKTQKCLERVEAALRSDPFARVWILVPDHLQANETRKRLAGTGAVLAARVATFGDLHVEILERAGCSLPVAGDIMLHRLLQEVSRSLCESGQLPYYEPICAMTGFLLEVRDRIAELKRALMPPERLAEVAQARADAGLQDLARIYAAYQSRLQELGWADPEGLSWLAYAALDADAELMGGLSLLVVDGFDNFNPAQLRTLQALAGRVTEVWITLPGTPAMDRSIYRRFSHAMERLVNNGPVDIQTLNSGPNLPPTLRHLEAGLFETHFQAMQPGDDLERIEARSPAEEAREVLRWLKAKIVREGLPISACGVAVPEFDTYRAPLRAAGEEFGLALYFSQEPRLSTTPAAAAVTDLLGLAFNDYPLRSLLDTIRSPYFDLSVVGLQRADAKRLEIASRYGQVVQGIGQWEETLNTLASQSPPEERAGEQDEEEAATPRLPVGEQAARLLSGLRGLAAKCAPPTGTLSIKEWATWLEELLEGAGFFECTGRSGETNILQSFERLLFALARSEALTGACPTDYPGFLKEWEGLLAAMPVQAEEDGEVQPAIRVLRFLEGRGVRFQALALLGMAEGTFPAVERVDPFLSEEVRTELGMELRLGQEQAGLFYQLMTRADRSLLLTRPYLAKDGESWEASPYWNAVQELLEGEPARIHPDDARPLQEAASTHELLFWAVRRRAQAGLELPGSIAERFTARWRHIGETQPILASRLQREAGGPYDGNLTELTGHLHQRYGERAGWSASRLETYATCPFSFLASSALGLEVLEPPQIGYQANQLGSLLHEVLEQVYQEAPNPADTEEVSARLPEVARRVFAAAPEAYQFRPSMLWDVQQVELLAVLETAIREIAELDPDNEWRPRAFEAKFGLEGNPPVRIPAPGGEIRLHGIVDRIDINPHGELRVIDYKSGGSHLAAQDLVDGRRLQLPIYALAASQALGLGKPADGFYWKLFAGEASSLKLGRFQSEEGTGIQAAIALASAHIKAFVTGIRQGAFEPRAPQGGCPSYCVAAAWCWQFQAGRYY